MGYDIVQLIWYIFQSKEVVRIIRIVKFIDKFNKEY